MSVAYSLQKLSTERVCLLNLLGSAVFRAPQHPQLRGGAQTLEGAAREWEKFRLELKRAIPGYATDVFVMLELKTKLQLEKAPFFCRFAANRRLGTGYAEERDRRD